MASTYTTNNGIEQPGNGEQSGTWGTTVNTGLGLLDSAIDGNVSVTLSGTAQTITTTNGVSSTGRNKVLNLIGALAATCTVTIAPNTAKKLYFIKNATTGGFSVIISQGSGSTVTIANGSSAIVYCDGAGATAAVSQFDPNSSINATNITSGSLALARVAQGGATLGQKMAWNGTVWAPVNDFPYVNNTVTGTYTALAANGADQLFILQVPSAYTITLFDPALVGNGARLTFKNPAGSGFTVTLQTTFGLWFIEGTSTYSLVSGAAVRLVANGNWVAV